MVDDKIIENKSMDYSPNLNNLYESRISSGVLLLLNSPDLMEFGIDNQIWKRKEKYFWQLVLLKNCQKHYF